MAATGDLGDGPASGTVTRLYWFLGISLIAPCVGALLVAIGSPGSPWEEGVLWILYMGAAAALAAILGLIFGVPRARTEYSAEASERYSSNSNLEQISDWLTKLLVGAGLVELTSLPGLIGRASDFFGADMQVANAQAFAASALVYGAGVGFAAGYLWTRLRLRLLLESSDKAAADMSRKERRVFTALKAAQTGSGEVESNRDLQRAAKRAVATSNQDDQTRAILWVDDFPQNNTSIAEALRSLDIRVDTALATDEALGRLETEQYGLIISDLGRREPGGENQMAGLDLINAVRQSGRSTPIFIYAGRRGMHHEAELREAGANLVTDRPTVILEAAARAVTGPAFLG
jgi:CheY-like chemotaxis protein